MNNLSFENKKKLYKEISKSKIEYDTMIKYVVEVHKNDKELYKYIVKDTNTIKKFNLNNLITTLNNFT